MPEYLEIKGKKYRINEDIDYYYVKEYTKLVDNYNAEKIEGNPDEKFIGILAEAVCPTLRINFDDMSIDGHRLKFGEVKKLIRNLREAQTKIMEKQYDLIREDNIKQEPQPAKNDATSQIIIPKS